ncbi:MAG: TrkA C-terminal domain-containing protein [Lachnospirales bacterium]
MSYIFIFFAVVYMLIVKIYSILFQLTGLSKQKSLFQVASILTSTGFTTKESEIIIIDNTRRKLVFSLMIFGYASTIISISLVVFLLFHNYSATQYILMFLYISFFYLIGNTKFVTMTLKSIVKKVGNKHFYGESNNSIFVLLDYGNKVLAEININQLPKSFNGVQLKDLEIFQKFELNLLSIQRKNLNITTVNDDHIIKVGDQLIVYGDIIKMTYVFQTMIKNDLEKENQEIENQEIEKKDS